MKKFLLSLTFLITICLSGYSQCTPSVSITANKTTICQGISITFTAVAKNQGTAPVYEWFINNISQGAPSSPSTFTAYALSPINNSVSVKLTSNATCAGTTQVTSNPVLIEVKPVPNPVIIQTDPTICNGESFIFSCTNNAPGSKLQWQFNAFNISQATNVNYAATQAGQYTIVEDNGYCTAASSVVTLTIIPTPVANAGADQHVNVNDVVTLQASGGTTGTVYSWVPATGLDNTTISNPTFTAQHTTTYVVTVSNKDVTSNTTCSNSASVIVYVNNTSTATTTSLAQSGIQFYPNPSTDAFNIVMPQSGTLVQYSITDLSGTAVASGSFTSTGGAEKIATNFNTGLYQVVLTYNETVTCIRLNKVQ